MSEEAKRRPYKGALTTKLMDTDVGEGLWLTLESHEQAARTASNVLSAIRRSPNLDGKEFSCSTWTAVRAGEVRYLMFVERTT